MTDGHELYGIITGPYNYFFSVIILYNACWPGSRSPM